MNHINHATERALAKELRTYTRYPICTQGADVIVRLADQLEAQDRHREQVAEMGRKVVEKAEAEITALRAQRDKLAALVEKTINVLDSAVGCEKCELAECIDLALAVLKEPS